MNCPVWLSDSVAVTGNQSKPLTEQSFRNPFLTAMLLDEIRFLVDCNELPDTADNFRGYGGNIQCSLSLGRLPLTGGNGVPLWSFGPPLSTCETFGTDTSERYTFRLKHPLYVPPGESVKPRILHSAINGNTNTTNVQVTLVGRSVERDYPVPASIKVPWVTCWQGTNNPGAAAYTDESVESDLCNPFNSPLSVDYMLGRMLQTSGGPGDATEPSGATDALVSTSTLVRIADQASGPVVRDETQFSHLFQRPERVFRCRGAVMPPKSFYKIWLREAWATFSAASSWQPHISLVGYRDVALLGPSQAKGRTR